MEVRLKAIFVSGIDYESPIQIGDHHLARQFAINGWQTAFISLPITPFHYFSKNTTSIYRKYQNYKLGGYKYRIGSGTLWSYVPGAFIIPKNNQFMNFNLYKNWYKFIHPHFNRLLRDNNFDDVDLVYIRDPLQAYILNSTRYKYSIYRMADNDAGFDNYNEHYAYFEKSLAQKVDLVLYTAMGLLDRINQLNPHQSMYFPNGVDLQHFENADKSLPPEYLDIQHPIVVYAGSIDYWFNFDLLNKLTQELPDISFVIIGPNEQLSNNFISRNNLHYLGPISYNLLPRYLYNANIGIIPFNSNEYPELVSAINPIKLYEYMACGLPVVATKWNELANIQSPAILCNSDEEFITSLRNVSENKSDKRKYQEFAERFDWGILYSKLIQKIGLN